MRIYRGGLHIDHIPGVKLKIFIFIVQEFLMEDLDMKTVAGGNRRYGSFREIVAPSPFQGNETVVRVIEWELQGARSGGIL